MYKKGFAVFMCRPGVVIMCHVICFYKPSSEGLGLIRMHPLSVCCELDKFEQDPPKLVHTSARKPRYAKNLAIRLMYGQLSPNFSSQTWTMLWRLACKCVPVEAAFVPFRNRILKKTWDCQCRNSEEINPRPKGTTALSRSHS